MGALIQKWITEMERNWGLKNFDLKNISLRRESSAIKTTEYLLDIEWFPPGTEIEDDLNPSGTVVVEVNVSSGFLTSFIVVMSEDCRNNPPSLSGTEVEEVVAWIELHTGLKQNIDFKLNRKNIEDDNTEYYFTSILQGGKTSPGGYIDVKVNKAGVITFYSLSGFFHALHPEILIDTASLQPLKNVAKMKEKQIVLFGLMEEKGYRLLYGVEEIFIEKESDEIILHWNEKNSIKEVPRSQGRLGEYWEAFRKSQTISEEEIEKNIPHPDTLPITGDERAEFLEIITHYMGAHRPKESGKWKVENLERQQGLLNAVVIPIEMIDRTLDKFKFLYHPDEHVLVEVLDKRKMLSGMVEILSQNINVSIEEAMEILEKDIYFQTFFVYDGERNMMRKMHWIDCHVFVDAVTGEKVYE